jgi:hypothetical protein
MAEHSEIQDTEKPQGRRNEVCTASVGLSAALSAATIAVVVVVVLLLLLT